MPAVHPVVSVVIPAYNAAEDLGETLESVRVQTLRDFEALIVNDGSTDGTRGIADGFIRRDPRFRLLEQDNRGVGEARNRGIREARGRYIAPLDADDRWHPEKLAKQVARMEQATPETALVYCWSRRTDRQQFVQAISYPYQLEGHRPAAMVLRNFVGNASVPLLRAAALREVGLYLTRADQQGRQGCEDWDLHIRIAERYAIAVVGEYLADYLQTPTAMSLNTASMAASGRCVLRRARQRNSHLPVALFRWSAGHFYSYLSRKCYLWGDYWGTLHAAALALATDPANALNPGILRACVRSLVHLPTRGAFRRHPVSKPGPAAQPSLTPSGSPLFTRIELRRWEVVNAADVKRSMPPDSASPILPGTRFSFFL